MSDTEKKLNFEPLKAGFMEHLTLRNLAPLTRKQNDLALRIFMGYAAGHSVTEPGQVDAAFVERYKAYLAEEYTTTKGLPLHAETIRERIETVQRWFEWMKKTGVIFFNPTSDIKLPTSPRRLPYGVLRPEEITKIMEQPDLRRPLGYRDRTVMEVLYASGLRANELVGLRVGDVDLQKKVLRVRNGKGGRQRFAPLSTPCCRFLERYISETRPQLVEDIRPCGNNWMKKAGTGEDLLFLSIYGGPLTRNWLASLMKQYIAKAGIGRRVAPVHGFRHSVATHLIEDGMDVRYVQVLLGHENINSTQIYTHVERKTLQKFLDEKHPRARTGETVQAFAFIEEVAANANPA
jgi:integrase/recombinase XerD